MSDAVARTEAERPAGEQKPDEASPKESGKRRRGKASPFSTAGRELTDDELYRIVGGL